jgi:competence ComEA-like helix-hairpin-helix protein
LDVDASGDGRFNGAARFERAVHRREQEALMFRSPLVALATLLAITGWPPSTAVAAAATRAETVNASASVGSAKININTAGVKELMTLSGVGRSLAEKIVKYRDTHGLFKKREDLRNVEGVGAALWEKNRERIVVK